MLTLNVNKRRDNCCTLLSFSIFHTSLYVWASVKLSSRDSFGSHSFSFLNIITKVVVTRNKAPKNCINPRKEKKDML
jgi:hypothetical protein